MNTISELIAFLQNVKSMDTDTLDKLRELEEKIDELENRLDNATVSLDI